MIDKNTVELDLDKLEALARAADQDGQHIYTNARDSNNHITNTQWQQAASPAVFLQLIAKIRSSEGQAQTSSASPIGYISQTALIELQDPNAPDNLLTLRHSKSENAKAQIPVYIAAQLADKTAKE